MEISTLDKRDILRIRPMWEELNALHGRVSTHFKNHFNTFTFEDRLKQIETKEAFAVFVAQKGQSLAGYCIASIDAGAGEIDSIYLDPEHRSHGIGEGLFLEAETWLKSKNAVTYQISVVDGNESVFEFYGRQGYHPRCTILEKKFSKSV